MADFTIDVGFNTENISGSSNGGNGVDSGVSNGPNAGGKSGANKNKGFNFRQKLTNFIKEFKIISTLLGAIVAILTIGILLFVKSIYEYFKERPILKLGIFLANAFIGAIEKLAELITPVGDLDFGRFRSDIITEELDSGTGLFEALKEGFMTEEEYQKNKITKALLETKKLEDAHRANLRANDLRVQLENNYANEVSQTLDPAIVKGSNAFLEFWNNFITEVNKMNEEVTGDGTGVSFNQSRRIGPLTNTEILGGQRNQSLDIPDRDARAYNYLVGLGR